MDDPDREPDFYDERDEDDGLIQPSNHSNC